VYFTLKVANNENFSLENDKSRARGLALGPQTSKNLQLTQTHDFLLKPQKHA
jgi:hypothetical protein